jgi:hypothetical protein
MRIDHEKRTMTLPLDATIATVIGFVLLLGVAGLVGAEIQNGADDGGSAVVVDRTTRVNLPLMDYCVQYTVSGTAGEQCFGTQGGVIPDCYAQAKIGSSLPESCR